MEPCAAGKQDESCQGCLWMVTLSCPVLQLYETRAAKAASKEATRAEEAAELDRITHELKMVRRSKSWENSHGSRGFSGYGGLIGNS